MRYETNVGDRRVEVRGAAFVSVVTFRAGRNGNKEAGDYLFWAAVLKDNKSAVTARALAICDPGDRFRRIGNETVTAKSADDQRAYASLWGRMRAGRNIAYIRPATAKEIRRWMHSHKDDARYVVRSCVAGKKVKVR